MSGAGTPAKRAGEQPLLLLLLVPLMLILIKREAKAQVFSASYIEKEKLIRAAVLSSLVDKFLRLIRATRIPHSIVLFDCPG